jgi:membrane protein
LAAEGADRGRQATSPSEIPARGWKDIFWRLYGNIGDHRVLALAAGMTYYSLLAIFPAIAALVAIYGLFSDPSSIAKHLDEVAGFVPGGAVDVAREQLTRVATKGGRTLGFTFAIDCDLAVERERRHEVVIRHVEYRLRGGTRRISGLSTRPTAL